MRISNIASFQDKTSTTDATTKATIPATTVTSLKVTSGTTTKSSTRSQATTKKTTQATTKATTPTTPRTTRNTSSYHTSPTSITATSGETANNFSLKISQKFLIYFKVQLITASKFSTTIHLDNSLTYFMLIPGL